MRVHLARATDPEDRYVYIQESYRDEKGKPRNRTLERHGLLSALLAEDPDALERLEAHARQLTQEGRLRRGVVEYDTSQPNSTQLTQVVGWWLIDAVWTRLGLDRFYRDATKTGGWSVDVESFVRVLVASRILWPCSKKASVERAPRLLGAPVLDPASDAVYRCLDRVAQTSLQVQTWARSQLSSRDLGVVFYDVTNFFFHIDTGDDDPKGKDAERGEASRQRGYSKEASQSPIIQMGLLLGPEGLPLAFRLFDGNVGDVSTLSTVVEELTTVFNAERVVVVADKALNARPAARTLAGLGHGWIFSASARKTTAAMRDWILDKEGWSWVDEEHTTRIKSRIVSRLISDKGEPKRYASEKVIARWRADYAARDAQIRTEILTKAAKLAANPDKYVASNRRGVKRYIRDTNTGGTPRLEIDTSIVEADALLDGYWLVHTSETTTPDMEILAHYHNLWRIEQTFRVTKTDLEARPVYVSTPQHIEAHFTVCFLALLVARILEQLTGATTEQLATILRDTTARHVHQGVYLLDRPEAWDHLDTITGTTMNQEWATITELRAWRQQLANKLPPI